VIGALVSPLAFLLTLSAYLVFSGVRTLPRDLAERMGARPRPPTFLGYAIFAVAFCISVVYLLQEKPTQGQATWWNPPSLPSLEALDDLNFRFVAWGFALVTVGSLRARCCKKHVGHLLVVGARSSPA